MMRGMMLSFIAGMFIGAIIVAWWYQPIHKHEPPAAEARQDDGSLVLERAQTKARRPAHAIPKGGEPERDISVVVQPGRADCPVCVVDLTLVKMPDDSRRVVASSPTGNVIGGLDIPIIPMETQVPRLWATGVSYGGHIGLFVDRDLGPLRVGVEVNRTDDDGYDGRLKIGFRF